MPAHRLLFLFLLVLAGVTLPGFHAAAKASLSADRFFEDPKTPWEITAKSLSYLEQESIYVAEGDVLITRGEHALYTQNAIYNLTTGIVTLRGGFRLETRGDILIGKEGTFNLQTQTGEIVEGSLFLRENHFYIDGKRMEKVGPDTYRIQECRITTCEGENPDWTITGSEVTVTIDGYGTVKHAAFRARDFPLLYLPYMIFPAKTRRQTGFLPPSIGYSTLNGAEIEIPFFWAISDQTDATFYQRYMSSRGYMQGAEFRYLANETSKGVLELDFLSDLKKSKDLNDKDARAISPYERTNQSRYWVRGMADQDLPANVLARLDLDYVSDQDYLREFQRSMVGFEARTRLTREFNRPVEEKRSPTRRSALRVNRDGQSYSLQGLASYYQSTGDPSRKNQLQQPVGGIDFLLLQEQIRDLPVFFHLDSGYQYVWSDQFEKGHSLSLSPRMNFPLWLGPYVEMEPSFRYTYNALWVDSGQESTNRQYQSGYEAKTRLGTSLERVFGGALGAEKLRHKLRPSMEYTYRGYQTDTDGLPWFEPVRYDDYMTSWFASLSDDERDDVSRNRVALMLENFLDARLANSEGVPIYQQWATFKLYQGYNLDEARREVASREKKKPFTPLAAQLIVTPMQGLDLRGATEWDHYRDDFTRTTVSGQFTVNRAAGRKDYYEVNYQYYRDENVGQTNVNLRADVHLLHGFSVGGAIQRDIDAETNIVTAGWLGYETQCWAVRLGAEREYQETNVLLLIRLMGLGDTGKW